MGRRTVLPPWFFKGREMARRLGDIARDQAAARPRNANPMGLWDVADVAELKRIVRGLFGDNGLIELDQHRPGWVRCGYFLDDKETAPIGTERKRVFPFEGGDLASIRKQVASFRAKS